MVCLLDHLCRLCSTNFPTSVSSELPSMSVLIHCNLHWQASMLSDTSEEPLVVTVLHHVV